MWCASKSPDAMGLPSMNKRKIGCEEDGGVSPPKQCRGEDQAWVGDAPTGQSPLQRPNRPASRLEELASVAPPDWAVQRPPLLTTLLADDDDFDDDDFEEEEEEERYLPSGRNYSCRYSSEQCFEDQGYGGSGSSPARTPCPRAPPYWGYPTSPPQQTIRCEENGKSYLELGASPLRTPSAVEKCCDTTRTSWCRRTDACYRQRRLAVFNLSMCKLGRFRQFTDPSLLRSVLICNTLRYIEREMEQEGCFYNGPASCQAPPPAPPTEVNPTFPPPQFLQVPDLYESSGRATPYPMLGDNDSGVGDDTRSINWGSVLSLSSQSALDPINNNELYSNSSQDGGHDLDEFLPSWKLTPVSAEEVLKTAPDPATSDLELMQVLVSS